MMDTEIEQSPVFLVLEQDPVVAQDLVELLRVHRSDADIHLSRSQAETAAMLERFDHISAAILDGGVDDHLVRELTNRIGRRNGRVIVLHDLDVEDPRMAQDQAIFIRRPFTSDMILAALSGR